MHRIRILIVLLCTGFLWMACADLFDKSGQLQKAILTVDTDPQETLRMLEGMNPQHLDKSEQMQYVVLSVQARYMDYQDITADTLILEAQRYFAKRHQPELAARASYYAASFWYENRVEEKALEYYLLANYYAEQAGNQLFRAKSTYGIALSYYNQDMPDSSLVYYQKSVSLYQNEKDSENQLLELNYSIGKIYQKQGEMQHAYVYFNNGLTVSRKLHKKNYEFLFLQNLGINHRNKKEFDEAKAFFNQALSLRPDAEHSLRIDLSYAMLYRAAHQPDSAKHYLDLIKSRVAEFSYPINRSAAYHELASYYKDEGNIHEKECFLKLASEEDLKIKELQNEKSILLINRIFEQFLKFEWFKQEAEKKHFTTLKIGLIAIAVLGFLLIVFKVDKRKLKEKYQELRYQNLFQKMDWQNSLIGSLKGVSQTADAICMDDQPITAELVRRQMLPLRVKFSMEFAALAREGLVQFPNGDKASHQLDSEDLCMIYLKQLNHTDESISWMLGYERYSKFYIDSRKREIRHTLTKAGMKENDIQTVFPW